MKKNVVIKSFSGDIQISSKQFEINDYYDTDIKEIDDSDYIREHKIDRVEQHFYSDTGYILYINYYDAQGIPYRFDEIKNGIVHTEEL